MRGLRLPVAQDVHRVLAMLMGVSMQLWMSRRSWISTAVAQAAGDLLLCLKGRTPRSLMMLAG
jgi:hypothetical protein